LSDAQRFGVRFFAILLAVSAIVWAVELPDRLGPVQAALARSAAWLAHAAGSTSTVEYDQIYVRAFAMDINYECTGVYVLLILFTFLLAYPSSWFSRLTGALLGVAGLTTVNVLRIAFLVRVAELQPDLFAYLHEYVWQGVFLVLVIVYAMTWVERVK
jgi:exosortase/archaeosortase family protein